uniref:dTDP-6-deoxy-L-talose 4-dehydrogenase (NAD+) n=1 Tax=Candidatus Kentrum sp. DK TaxID=2126562 RepID=A0A450S922_9GAMM|nr:MAG: dTDP-6-deoxy-L-talose 4-dehydrogenase (NAD+) [Candidatus Kentron sp. DK]
MKLFVTGGTGFIGSHFLNAAHHAGHEIIALKRAGSEPPIELNRQPIWVEGDLSTDCSEHLEKCDALIYIAAFGVSPQPANWKDCFYWNVFQSIRLFHRAAEAGIDKMLAVGSYAEYGESGPAYSFIPPDAPLMPIGPYPSSKAAFSIAAQGLCREKHLRFSYIRLFSAYGEGQYEASLWPSLKKAAFEGRDFPMTPGEQVRDFIPVEEVAQKLVEELEFKNVEKGKPRVVNLGSGKPLSVLEFSRYFWEKWNARGKLQIGRLPYRNNEVMRCVPELE